MTMGQSTSQRRTKERREERAERILDATKELILRWGYRKTTLDDIARQAEVGKGTLFLHWPNRDTLFVSLLLRERLGMLTDIRDTLAEAPGTATVERFFYRHIQAYRRRPLLTALVRRDQSTLGRLAEQRQDGRNLAERRVELVAYFEELGTAGVVRDDRPANDLVHVVVATIYGFISIDQFLAEDSLTDDHAAELCADGIARITTSNAPRTADLVAAESEITMRHADRMLAITQRKYQASLDEPGGTDTV
ncbi:helix-turn-helix transcriptional regulator [Spiractinospora alimapuensis]|uniref:TetR/AcrR family transcriptional regulator n=1 Tax=Spiractinospora alimapuensis TaxID=2820884 RepID=UPI001F29D301|nr:TetR/AcrR family transcriptional regulator [Spiractinospora alimapuensis]QVQ50892.1 helix-turn-helix transcriptional regulator [Spiractinospora alimapuensis]